MRLQSKIILTVLPLVLLAIFGIGLWSFTQARNSVYESTYRYIALVLDTQLSSHIARRAAILMQSKMDGIAFFVAEYQREALQALTQVSQAQSGHFFILDASGRFVFSSQQHAATDLEAVWGPIARDVVHNPPALPQGYVNTVAYHDLYVVRQFQPWQWVVFYSITDDHVNASVNRILFATFGVAGLCGLCSILAIILLARRFLARPMRALQHAATSIAKQEAVEAIAVHTHDEFGALARSMERMSTAIREYNAQQLHLQDELRDSNAALTAEIAERKYAEAKRQELILELEAKNAELERFTYTVSHDLKSPLITIHGFLGLLRQDTVRGETAKIEADIAHIAAAATMMGSLLDNLLDLSRIGRVVNVPQAVAFGELVHEALDLVRGQLAEREVDVVIAPDLPRITGDRSRLVEVLQNLLDNAIKFLGDQPQPQITVGCRQEDAETVLYVQDNGMGIEPRYHDKVFGLFERLDPTSAGTGIGLALVKRIIEVHGGRIWVESAGQGDGCTICFTLAEEKEGSIAYHVK